MKLEQTYQNGKDVKQLKSILSPIKFNTNNFGTSVRARGVFGNFICLSDNLVPWMFIVIIVRSDKYTHPWMKPLIDTLNEDDSDLHCALKVACVEYRKG